MKSFAALILSQKKNRGETVAITDCNGSRNVNWDTLRQGIFKVADFAVSKKLSGVVPIHMERTAEAYESLIGLNLAGVGVAPLSITTPDDRCRYISELVQNEVWTKDTYEQAMAQSCPQMDWDRAINEVGSFSEADPAYVVFTSGSTGNPKGVMLSNDAIIGGMMRAASPDFFGYDEEDIVLQAVSLSFIAVAADLLAPLYMGCPVHILPEDARGDNTKISAYIRRHNITKLFMSPQLYRTFEGGPSLKCVCIGGDRIINIAPKGHRLVSVYGMTEMAGFAFHYDIKEAMTFTPIGVPSVGIREYVVDENGNLADEGEMCVSGSVAHGYMNLPEMNAITYTPNPFSDEPGHQILLHSGDIVRKIENGGYRYLNRKDHMLKINGQRVEPGEIEIALTDCQGIGAAAVKGFSDDEGRSIICAYYVGDDTVEEAAVKETLEKRLPHYMVPGIFVRLDKMPLNANGKLDRKALVMPDLSDFRNEYIAPTNEVEENICQGFAKALRLSQVGIKDDFFRLGGDSIGALSVVKFCEALNISTGDVLTGRTPEAIARILKEKQQNFYTESAMQQPSAPLTDSQMGIYLECMLCPESVMYNIPVEITVKRPSNMSAEEICRRVDSVIALHPALYAKVDMVGEDISLIRMPFPNGGICTYETDKGETAIPVHPFPLNQSPLCRARVLITDEKTGDNSRENMRIQLDTHHIVSDGTSVQILCRQLCHILSGKSVQPETVDAFALYEAEEKLLRSIAHEESQKYYEELLCGVDTDGELLPDKKGQEGNKHPQKRISVALDIPEIKQNLRTTDLTENTLFMGAFGYALAKMTGKTETVFAAGENGRRSSLLDSTVSMLVRTLPVVIRLDETKTGKEYLKSLQQQFFHSVNYDSMSFGELSRKYGIKSDFTFVYQSDMLAGCEDGETDGATMIIGETGEAFSKLSVSVLKNKTGFELLLEYRPDLYHESTIRRFAAIFASAVKMLTEDVSMENIPLITDEEKELLNSFFQNKSNYEKSETVVDVFRRIAMQNSQKIALVSRGNSYTYGQVDSISDKLAAYITTLGIGREHTVSVLIPRSEYMMIATLGILKAGAIYEPLDPSYPPERLNFMVKDADAKLVIADRGLISILTDYRGPVLFTDEIGSLPEGRANLETRPKPDDTYTLLYTSGTTGKPKGCMLSHGNLMAFVHAHTKTLQLTAESRLASYASYGFDAHMADLYPSIVNACELHIVPDEIRLDFPALKDYLETNAITHLCMTTQVARQFAVEYGEIRGMQCISAGGEKLISFTPSGNYRVLNLYGPTECTVCVTSFEVTKNLDNIPIGHSMENCRIYVVDPQGRRVPVGVPGELIISGPQVGKGYLNRSEQTEKVFVKNTYENIDDGDYARCYKTGDIVRYLEDGNIEFIGRRDLQVKIRGFRIELAEVEKVIREYPGITDATVVAADCNGGKCIHAYVVSSEKVDIAKMNAFIKERKPAYMVPAATMQIDRIPLTPNHKVDRRKLPPMEQIEKPVSNESKILTDLETSLLALLGEIVGDSGAGVSTEFADAGVTSISSIKLATQIYKKFGVHISSKEILDGGSVLTVENKIVAELMNARSASAKEPVKRLKRYPLTQTQMGIYLDSQRAVNTASIAPLARSFSTTLTVRSTSPNNTKITEF